MPKVTAKPPQQPQVKYRTTPAPESTFGAERRECLNGQSCTCGHDRLCHSCFVGEGESRLVFVDAPNVGECGVTKCHCARFVFDPKHTSEEGKKRYNTERKKYKVVPPSK